MSEQVEMLVDDLNDARDEVKRLKAELKEARAECRKCKPLANKYGSYASFHATCRELRSLRARCFTVLDERGVCAALSRTHTQDYGHGDNEDYRRGRADAALAIAHAIEARSN